MRNLRRSHCLPAGRLLRRAMLVSCFDPIVWFGMRRSEQQPLQLRRLRNRLWVGEGVPGGAMRVLFSHGGVWFGVRRFGCRSIKLWRLRDRLWVGEGVSGGAVRVLASDGGVRFGVRRLENRPVQLWRLWHHLPNGRAMLGFGVSSVRRTSHYLLQDVRRAVRRCLF